MTHIRRDGFRLCKSKLKPKEPNISFSAAHKANLGSSAFCTDCVERYYEIVSKMNPPIVIK